MRSTDVAIIGAGQAGLAMSRSLSRLGIDHVVLERGQVGERWRSQSWRSLTLVTPACHSALPGRPHAQIDPEDFLSATAFVDYLESYRAAIAAPVETETAVTDLRAVDDDYRLSTTRGDWQARSVVIATGAYTTPFRPAMTGNLPPDIHQIDAADYRAADELPPGSVLVVGGSSTGLQIADELSAAGRQVMLAVGEHMRMPRRYRGDDIYVQLHRSGILDDHAEQVSDLAAARRQPSMQLIGRPDRSDLNCATLRDRGVALFGRLLSIEGTQAFFANDLVASVARSDERMRAVLSRIDAALALRTEPALTPAADRIAPIVLAPPPCMLDLAAERVSTVIWATGYVRRYPWLCAPVLDADGELVHRGGVTPRRGLYALGLNFMRRRRSHFIDGCGLDAVEIADEIAKLLRHRKKAHSAPGRLGFGQGSAVCV